MVGAKLKLNGLLKHVPLTLLDSIVKGTVVPFVGAGFSRNCNAPNGFVAPDWKGLGKCAAEKLTDYVYDDNPLEALSVFEDQNGRPALVEFIRDACGMNSILPGSTHKAFCHCFQDVVCTTNFDTLLEQTYRELHTGLQVVTDEAGLAVANDGVTVIKVHGDCDHPGQLVATERDYDLFVAQNPLMSTFISSLFITKTMLLVGYSLDDVDMRQLLSIVRDRLGKNSRPVYCVQVGASVADISRFKRRGVEVINLPRRAKESYAEVLSRFFSELRDYINKKAECLTSCTTEEGREEMIRPKANNNLCFVGCSIARAAGLKKLLGPIIRDSGAVPVWPENIVSQRVSRKNACKAVATKSAVRIFDITDANPQVLALLQIAREDNATKTIMIREVSDGANQDVLKDLPEVLYYVIDDSDLCVVEAEQARIFRSEIQKCIIDSIRYNGKSLGDVLNDAESLLKEGYYDAALLSAFAQLERVLRSDRTPALGCSIRKLCEARLQDGEMRDIDRYLSLRNSVAHGLGSASEKDVNSFVRIVRRIIDKHSVIRENSSIVRRHTSARSCQIFVSITLFPWEISKGPTYNTVYPTDWASYGIPGDALLDDESFDEFVENKTALRVLDYTGRSLVNWTPREVQNRSGNFDYTFQATCSNPFDEAQTWFVTAWVKFD